MEEEIMFVGMDINAELDKILKQLLPIDKNIPEDYRNGVKFTQQTLKKLLEYLSENYEDDYFKNLIVQIDNLETPTEFDFEDLSDFIQE